MNRIMTVLAMGTMLCAGNMGVVHGETVFQEQNGYVCIEAESVEPGGEWVVHTSTAQHDFIDGFTGEGCIHFTGNSEQSGSVNSPIAYTIDIDTPGEYALIIRGLEAPLESGDGTWANDCYAMMEGQSDYLGQFTKHVLLGGSFSWSWDVQAEDGQHNFKWPVYTLDAGQHVFKIAGRSKNFMIDRFVLYKDISKNDAEALSLAPSPIAGAIQIEFLQPAYSAVAQDSTVTVELTASSDSGSIASITLWVDGVEEKNVANSTLSTELSDLSGGTHELSATAYTDYGDSATAAHTLTVYDDADIIYLKAEEATLSNGMTSVQDAQALSGTAIYGSQGSTGAPAGGDSRAEYEITIPSEGTWYAWGRFSFPDGQNNSYWIAVDGETAQRFGNGETTFDTYHWEGYMSQGAVDLGHLAAGTHTLTIYAREAHTDNLLDALCLSANPDYTPNDADADLQPTVVSPRPAFAATPGAGSPVAIQRRTHRLMLHPRGTVVIRRAVLLSPDGSVHAQGRHMDGSWHIPLAASLPHGVYIVTIQTRTHGTLRSLMVYQ
jgi:hypothetical protein